MEAVHAKHARSFMIEVVSLRRIPISLSVTLLIALSPFPATAQDAAREAAMVRGLEESGATASQVALALAASRLQRDAKARIFANRADLARMDQLLSIPWGDVGNCAMTTPGVAPLLDAAENHDAFVLQQLMRASPPVAQAHADIAAMKRAEAAELAIAACGPAPRL